MKTLLRILVISLLSLVSMQSVQAQTTWTCPEGFEGQQLGVYNWSTYIADDTIPNFEELCGVTVTYDTYPTDGDMLSRIRQGNPGYDIVVPTAGTAQVMIEEGLLEELDFANIPNFVNVAQVYVNPVFDPENKYTVPYQVGGVRGRLQPRNRRARDHELVRRF